MGREDRERDCDDWPYGVGELNPVVEFEEEEGPEMSWCPEHGMQVVLHHSTTKGADPYDVQHLECGCRTIWYSADRQDCHIIGQR